MLAPKQRFQFDFEWRITLFTALMVPLMVGLGFWQLQRAADKAALAASFESRQQQAPAALSKLLDKPADLLAYAPVQLSGHFLPDAYFLLDNQVRNGRVGYEILAVMQLSEAIDGVPDSVLVNRGWIAAGADRSALPVVPQVSSAVQITGHVYVAPGAPFLLAEQQFDRSWPQRIQAVEMDKLIPQIAALDVGRVFPYPIRLDAGEDGALVIDWQVVNMSPSKHRAYAVQWFTMAAVLFAYFLFRSSNITQVLKGSARAGD